MVFIITWGWIHAFYDKELEENPVEKLKKDLHEVIFHVDPTAQIGIKVLSLNNGKVLFESNSYQRFIPGASIKLLTAAAALKIRSPSISLMFLSFN